MKAETTADYVYQAAEFLAHGQAEWYDQNAQTTIIINKEYTDFSWYVGGIIFGICVSSDASLSESRKTLKDSLKGFLSGALSSKEEKHDITNRMIISHKNAKYVSKIAKMLLIIVIHFSGIREFLKARINLFPTWKNIMMIPIILMRNIGFIHQDMMMTMIMCE